MRHLPGRLLGLLFSVAFCLGLLEVAMRAAPGALVPLELLKRFRTEVRVEIAQRLGLNNESQVREISRDDGGPALWLPKPFMPVAYPTGEGMRATQMDSQGFCNPPRDAYERPAIDLFAIGDSFTACLVADMGATWTSQLGEITGLAVYNLGRGGIGPYEYLQILQHFGLPRRPRYVVMNVYEGNDLRDALRYHEVAASHGGDGAIASDRNRDPIDYQALLDHPLGRTSYAVNLVVVALGQAWEGIRNGVLRLVGSEAAPEEVDFRYTLRFAEGEVPFNVENADESEVRHARMLRAGTVSLEAFDDALARFGALAREHGFTAIVSYTPSAYTAYAPFVEFRDPSLAELLTWFHAEQVRYLETKARGLGMRFVDLTPALAREARARQGRDLLYDPTNVHCTPSGHRVQAETLAEVLFALERGGAPAFAGAAGAGTSLAGGADGGAGGAAGAGAEAAGAAR